MATAHSLAADAAFRASSVEFQTAALPVNLLSMEIPGKLPNPDDKTGWKNKEQDTHEICL